MNFFAVSIVVVANISSSSTKKWVEKVAKKTIGSVTEQKLNNISNNNWLLLFLFFFFFFMADSNRWCASEKTGWRWFRSECGWIVPRQTRRRILSIICRRWLSRCCQVSLPTKQIWIFIIISIDFTSLALSNVVSSFSQEYRFSISIFRLLQWKNGSIFRNVWHFETSF